MTHTEKVAYGHRVIEHALATSKNPAVLCSFGKDSMVLLHMLREHADLPVIFWKHAFQPKKYRFANSVIEHWNLRVHDYAPVGVEMHENGDEIGMLSHYQIGAKTIACGTGIYAQKEGDEHICALESIYFRPTGTFNCPWDLVFSGHKSDDVDPIIGAIPLNSDLVQNPGCASLCYPIRFFSDDDIWEYTRRNKVPVHEERYVENRKEANPDYITACTACMSRNGPDAVPCPKRGGIMVANCSSSLHWAAKLDLVHQRA